MNAMSVESGTPTGHQLAPVDQTPAPAFHDRSIAKPGAAGPSDSKACHTIRGSRRRPGRYLLALLILRTPRVSCLARTALARAFTQDAELLGDLRHLR